MTSVIQWHQWHSNINDIVTSVTHSDTSDINDTVTSVIHSDIVTSMTRRHWWHQWSTVASMTVTSWQGGISDTQWHQWHTWLHLTCHFFVLITFWHHSWSVTVWTDPWQQEIYLLISLQFQTIHTNLIISQTSPRAIRPAISQSSKIRFAFEVRWKTCKERLT